MAKKNQWLVPNRFFEMNCPKEPNLKNESDFPPLKHTPIIPGNHKSAAPTSFHYSAETLTAPNSPRPLQWRYPWINQSHSLFAYWMCFFHAKSSDVSSNMLLYWVRAIFVARHRQMRAPVQILKNLQKDTQGSYC